MKIGIDNLENLIFDYFDRVRTLISSDIWENILLSCTKNEIFILILLYRRTDVNMSQIADYINAPLNTATGIISRMEKKEMVRRERSVEDKRVVSIVMTDYGCEQIQSIIREFIRYGELLMKALTEQEIEVIGNLLDKAAVLLSEDSRMKKQPAKNKIKRIMID